MGKRICPFCKEKVKQDATICKHCRSELAPLPPKKKSQLAGLLLILIIVAFFSGVFEEKPSSTSLTESDETTINYNLTTLSKEGKVIKDKYPNWSKEVCNAVAKSQIIIGMTKKQVETAWGRPYKINTTTGTYGTHEQWKMHDSINSSYVYFENGKLTTIQQSE